MEDITKVLCEILRDNEIKVDEVKTRQKLNKLKDNRTKKQNTQLVLNSYACTHKDGGLLDVHLANSKLTSLFDIFYVFSKSPSDDYPTVSTYNIDKPIQTHKKLTGKNTKLIFCITPISYIGTLQTKKT